MPPLEQPNSIGRTHQAALVFVPVPLSTSTLTSDRLACRNCPTQSSSPSDGSFANVEQTLCQPRGPFELNATLEILRFSRVSIEGILEGLSVTRNLWCSVVFFFIVDQAGLINMKHRRSRASSMRTCFVPQIISEVNARAKYIHGSDDVDPMERKKGVKMFVYGSCWSLCCCVAVLLRFCVVLRCFFFQTPCSKIGITLYTQPS